MGGHKPGVPHPLTPAHRQYCDAICPLLHTKFPPCGSPPQCSCTLKDYGHDMILSVTTQREGSPYQVVAKMYTKYPKKSHEKVSI